MTKIELDPDKRSSTSTGRTTSGRANRAGHEAVGVIEREAALADEPSESAFVSLSRAHSHQRFFARIVPRQFAAPQ